MQTNIHPTWGGASMTKTVRRGLVCVVLGVLLGFLGLLVNPGSASADMPSTTASAVQNANLTVTVTVHATGFVAGGACFMVLNTGNPADRIVCDDDINSHGAFVVSLTSHDPYNGSTISWQFNDAGGDLDYGPITTAVVPYVAPTSPTPTPTPTTTAPTSPTSTSSSPTYSTSPTKSRSPSKTKTSKPSKTKTSTSVVSKTASSSSPVLAQTGTMVDNLTVFAVMLIVVGLILLYLVREHYIPLYAAPKHRRFSRKH